MERFRGRDVPTRGGQAMRKGMVMFRERRKNCAERHHHALAKGWDGRGSALVPEEDVAPRNERLWCSQGRPQCRATKGLQLIYCMVSTSALRTALSTLAMSSLFPSSCTTSEPNEYTNISRAVAGSIPRDWK